MYEINYTNINDISEVEVSATEVAESGNASEIELLTEIRDIEKEQLSYLSFFVIIVLGFAVFYKLMKFLQSFFW